MRVKGAPGEGAEHKMGTSNDTLLLLGWKSAQREREREQASKHLRRSVGNVHEPLCRLRRANVLQVFLKVASAVSGET